MYAQHKNDNSNELILNQEFTVSYRFPVIYARGVFAVENNLLADLINNRDSKPVILPVIDTNVLAANPHLNTDIHRYFLSHNLRALPMLEIEGGEACKNNENTIDIIYQAVVDHKIDRHSYVLVIGGGAVIDAVGYAAATAHRGIRLIRMPTTVLAQNDAGVGVKNSVNYQKRKNFLGTFVPPHAVVCDADFINTLTARDKRAGISEAIKVSLIKDAEFFEELFNTRAQLAAFEDAAMQYMITKGAYWHLKHIGSQGDPFEMGSARPLDFGHWSAHKLEELSNNDLRHGEAVAIGIAMDSIYSHKVGYLNESALSKIIILLKTLGFQLYHPVLDQLDVAQALHEFKEHLGGRLCITLLKAIGHGIEVNEIDVELMDDALKTLATLSNTSNEQN